MNSAPCYATLMVGWLIVPMACVLAPHRAVVKGRDVQISPDDVQISQLQMPHEDFLEQVCVPVGAYACMSDGECVKE